MERLPDGFSADYWQQHLTKAAPEAFAHAFLVRRFVLLADRAKQPVRVPSGLWHFPNQKYSYLADFVKGKLYGEDGRFLTDRLMDPVFAIAQHHGIPTPLLDWTYNPVVAAYFAAEQSLAESSSEPLAVWALSESYLFEDAGLKRITIEPQVTPYLDAQEGLFTWHPEAYLQLKDDCFTPFDEVIRRDLRQIRPRRTLLCKLMLPAREATKLFNLLWHERIGRAYLMPGFDSVAKSLEFLARWGRSPQ